MRLLEELIENTVCGLVLLLTFFFFYDPVTLQDQ